MIDTAPAVTDGIEAGGLHPWIRSLRVFFAPTVTTPLLDEVLPWDHLSVGVSKQYLRREYERALAGATTDDCRELCQTCGILAQYRGERGLVPDDAWECPPLPLSKDKQPVGTKPAREMTLNILNGPEKEA